MQTNITTVKAISFRACLGKTTQKKKLIIAKVTEIFIFLISQIYKAKLTNAYTLNMSILLYFNYTSKKL